MPASPDSPVSPHNSGDTSLTATDFSGVNSFGDEIFSDTEPAPKNDTSANQPSTPPRNLAPAAPSAPKKTDGANQSSTSPTQSTSSPSPAQPTQETSSSRSASPQPPDVFSPGLRRVSEVLLSQRNWRSPHESAETATAENTEPLSQVSSRTDDEVKEPSLRFRVANPDASEFSEKDWKRAERSYKAIPK